MKGKPTPEQIAERKAHAQLKKDFLDSLPKEAS